MKRALTIIFLFFSAIILSANEKWIKIEPIDKTKTSKSNSKLNVNLSKIEPINKMLKNATVIKKLIDATGKKNEPVSNEKNWFILNTEDN